MGLIYRTFLEGNNIYACSQCKTHLATEDFILSKVNIYIIILYMIYKYHTLLPYLFSSCSSEVVYFKVPGIILSTNKIPSKWSSS